MAPALVESMFYTGREVPWHGLGRQVDTAPTSKDAIWMAGLDWRVESKPIFNEYGEKIEDFVANTRTSDNSVLGIVSPRYKIVQNEDAFAFTDSLLNEGITYETAGSLKDGKTIWLLAKMPEQKILDDKFDPYICFMNTHDGSGAIKVCSTPIRVVCNNTLNLALSTAKRSWSAKHVGDIKGKLEEAKETLGLANNYMKALEEEADKLANIKISDETFEGIVNEMYPIDYEKDSAAKINHTNIVRANLIACYAMPDIAKFKGTAWGVMNAVTDMIAHYPSNRMTASYQENNWGKIAGGHPEVDRFYRKVTSL